MPLTGTNCTTMRLKIIFINLLLGLSTLSAQTQLGSDINGQSAGAKAGSAVALDADGDRVVIGESENNNSTTRAGATRVLEYNGSAWVQIGSRQFGPTSYDYMGFAVDISDDGSTFITGIPRHEYGGNSNQGMAQVYEYDGSAWVQKGGDLPGVGTSDQAGYAVAISGDGSRVIVGMPFHDDIPNTTYDVGLFRVFEYSGGSWVQLGADIEGDGDNDQMGKSVGMSTDGTRVVIGIPGEDNNGFNAGQTRIYEYNSSVWIQLGNSIDGDVAGDNSAEAVTISGDGTRVAIGAEEDDTNGTNSGQVRIFELNGATWVQVGSDIDGASAGDAIGSSVSLSNDGKELVIGCRWFDNSTGTNAGHNFVYTESGGTWTNILEVAGEFAGDESGASVSISKDGTTVAFGGPFNDGAGTTSGHTMLYSTGVLPITLISFEAIARTHTVELHWSTGSEENNEGFYIERSSDGQNWREIGFVPGQINSNSVQNYKFIDDAPLTGANYYRFIQQDLDGTTSKSPVRLIVLNDPSTLLSVCPNPIQSGELNLLSHVKQTQLVTYCIRNLNGQLILQDEFLLQGGDQHKPIDVSMLEQGFYLLGIQLKQEAPRYIKFQVF